MKIFSKEEFVEQHGHINYCEAVIWPNGHITYINTSHMKLMQKLFCRAKGIKDNLSSISKYCTDNNISLLDLGLYYYCNSTGCVCLWYECYLGSPNELQKDTMKYLAQNKIIYGGFLK